MTDAAKLRTRAATPADASAIAAIYNEGIADRIATFETEPRSATDIAGWFTGEHLVVVAETGETGPVAFAASFPYSSRPCYRGIGEFSVYVRMVGIKLVKICVRRKASRQRRRTSPTGLDTQLPSSCRFAFTAAATRNATGTTVSNL